MSSLATIPLPDDLEWVDELTWSRVTQQTEISLGGALISEESSQLAGRPITLRSNQNGNTYYSLVTRDIALQLQALADTPRAQADAMALVLPDGRTTTVLFSGSAAERFSARPWRHIVPQLADDLYLIELRLQAVSAIVTPEP